jgi:hypothetical protein
MKTLGVTYFNKMYNSRGIDKGEFTDSLINELISKGCINAEIIYPQLNNAGFVQVIGTTDISDNACIYLNNCIIASDWNKFNLKVEGSFGGKRHEISPSGTDFICAIQGFSYNINDSTMAKGD